MSAYLCEPMEIGQVAARFGADRDIGPALERQIQYYLDLPRTPPMAGTLAEKIAEILAGANAESVMQRYGHGDFSELPGNGKWSSLFEYVADCRKACRAMGSSGLNAADAAVSVANIWYQCCESQYWHLNIGNHLLRDMAWDLMAILSRRAGGRSYRQRRNDTPMVSITELLA
ncbi:MAG: hypothetical protein OXC91_00725 [Rhodobacteraceae bacterium]|nr:hypothetical protein [Paracoccaceae bacterium]